MTRDAEFKLLWSDPIIDLSCTRLNELLCGLKGQMVKCLKCIGDLSLHDFLYKELSKFIPHLI